jgi:hypothetical protein
MVVAALVEVADVEVEVADEVLLMRSRTGRSRRRKKRRRRGRT